MIIPMSQTITAAHVFENLKKSILADGFDMVLDIAKSRGARLYDSKNNRTFIDFFSFFASNPLGMNHPKLFNKDFEKKLLDHARVKISNSDIYTEAYAEFIATFHQTAAPMFDRLFFIDGGALGVENAIKAAQDWKVQKNIAAGKGEKGTQVLHFKEAFHGRTGYTLSLTNTLLDKVQYFPKFDWPRITNPKRTFPETAESIQKTVELEKQSIAEAEKAFETRKDEICAIIIETIQGEGGDNLFRKEFFQKLRELADKHDAMLIFDEVQTGMGLTGRFWAFEHFGVMPDMIAFGKKTQVCGCAARMKRLDEVNNVFRKSSRINSTFGGNLVDMIRTTQFLDVIVEEKLLDHVTSMGATVKGELESFAKEFASLMSNVRGLGLWLAFDLPTKELRDEMVSLAWKKGLIVLRCGDRSIRLRPVLDLKEDEAQEGLQILKACAAELSVEERKKVHGHG